MHRLACCILKCCFQYLIPRMSSGGSWYDWVIECFVRCNSFIWRFGSKEVPPRLFDLGPLESG